MGRFNFLLPLRENAFNDVQNLWWLIFHMVMYIDFELCKKPVEGESTFQWPLYVITFYLFLDGALGINQLRLNNLTMFLCIMVKHNLGKKIENFDFFSIYIMMSWSRFIQKVPSNCVFANIYLKWLKWF